MIAQGHLDTKCHNQNSHLGRLAFGTTLFCFSMNIHCFSNNTIKGQFTLFK